MSRRKRGSTPRPFLDPVMADMIAGDLPDGAYLAMMEELTGMDGVEAVLALDDDEPCGMTDDMFAELIAERDARPAPPPRKRKGCPLCTRRFNDRHARADHMRDKHQIDAATFDWKAHQQKEQRNGKA